MRQISWLRFRETYLRAALCASILLTPTPTSWASGSLRQEVRESQSDIGLEIRLLDALKPLTRVILRHGVGGTVTPRQFLKIDDAQAAGEFTAVIIHAEAEGDALRVSVSIIYFAPSVLPPPKDRKEKPAGSYLLRAGESIRTIELIQFGIEPLEIKAMDARPVILQPGEGARTRNSATLEVEKLERQFDHYSVWLKNKSTKNIVAYSISAGVHTAQSLKGGYSYNTNGIVLAAGAVSGELHLNDPDIELNGIPVLLVVFEDGTFEGDPKLAVNYLARAEGVRIQAPSVLRRIEETLKVSDSDLVAAFVKLEAELWLIPEAMDKPTALQFLETKFPDQDDKSLRALYEVFKGGLYDGRNIALASLGDTLRDVRQLEEGARRLEERAQLTTAVDVVRRDLELLVSTFDKITSAKP